MNDKPERIGIFGGSFSPVHNGHVRAAEAFLRDIKPDILYIMPANIPPHKAISDGADAAERLEMAHLAFDGISKKIKVGDYEIKKGDTSYTIDTVRHFTAKERKIYLLVGTDMLECFEEWRDFRDILKLATLCCVRRDERYPTAAAEHLRTAYGAGVIMIDSEPIDISSTELRKRLCNGGGYDDYIPASVAEYIKQKGLYLQ